ncbi:hypothetical protein BTO30_03735 [Domibacillus antri]|uniref:PAS domain S-box protein n=1 Tax=Domibacillus antri TaxID=1714264 RepID=A0A1Q8Q875_9BACI|nr:EAL domain-containing protein [Domibacillus antri]OLN23547.1 hypothetical protein BTO30_03735 [Domibacillus antri]
MEPLQLSYQADIVVLSIFIAVIGAYTSLELMHRFTSAEHNRLFWLTGSSVMLGISVWAMHFTGMLSFHSVHQYDAGLTFVSLLASISSITIAFFFFYKQKERKRKFIQSGAIMGLGVITMHYIGMNTMNLVFTVHYQVPLVILSVIYAIALSTLFLFLWERLQYEKYQTIMMKTGAAVLFGLAISSIHYVGMFAVKLQPNYLAEHVLEMNQNSLVMAVAAVVFLLAGTGLVVSHKTKTEAERNAHRQELQYLSLFKHNTDGIFIFNKDGMVLNANAAAEALTGYTLEELKGTTFNAYIHPDDHSFVSMVFDKSLEGTPYEFQVRIHHKDGHELSLQVKMVPMLLEGRIDGVHTIVKDITNRLKIEKQLKEKEEQYRLIAENSSDLIRIVEVDGTVSYASPSHQHVLGYSPDELVGKRYDAIVHPDDRENLKKKYAYHFQEKKSAIVEYRSWHKEGYWIWIEAHSSPIMNDGVMSHFVVTAREITERKQYEEKLEKMAFYDVLTGIPNRRLFYDRLSQTITKAKRNNGELALFYLDCDRFKWVNDTYGHDTGDLLLKGFVERVQKCIRETDTLARFGGDEFAILLDGFDTVQDVGRIADRIIQNIQVPWNLNGHEFITTSSIGIALFPNDGLDMDTLLAHADQALYQSKEKGRNMYHFFTDELATQITRTMEIEEGLRQAVSKEHFHLVYQPQMNIQEGRQAGVEALLRYTHPQIGMIPPLEFIPLCEKNGIMNEVTEWVIREAFKQQKEWEKAGYGQISIVINISSSVIEDQLFPETVQQYMDEFEIRPGTMEFELTEATLVNNIDQVYSFMHKMKELGIGISFDDAGVGYSSFKNLKDMPIDKLKIDRSYIMDIPLKEKDRAIIESLLSLAVRLGFDVVCEGVETKEQLIYLQEKGCKFVQGYYYSEPLTKEKIETAWLNQNI